MRNGSITIGLLIGVSVAALITGTGAGWYAAAKINGPEHAAELQAAQDEAQALSASLGECQARVTSESVREAAQGTTDALGVALAPELADVGLRVSLVQGLTLDRYAEAIIETGSTRLVMADSMITASKG